MLEIRRMNSDCPQSSTPQMSSFAYVTCSITAHLVRKMLFPFSGWWNKIRYDVNVRSGNRLREVTLWRSWEFKTEIWLIANFFPLHQVNILKQNTKLMFEFLHDFYVYLYQAVCFIFLWRCQESCWLSQVTSASLVSSTLPGTRWHSVYLWGKRKERRDEEGINKWHGRAYSILTKKLLFCEQRNSPPLNFDFAIKKNTSNISLPSDLYRSEYRTKTCI